MTGTLKQIAWAEQIKADALHNCELRRDQAHNRFTETQFNAYADEETACKIMYAILQAIFAAHDDANWIIDHRETLSASNYSSKIDRWAELIHSGRVTSKEIAEKNGIKDYKE